MDPYRGDEKGQKFDVTSEFKSLYINFSFCIFRVSIGRAVFLPLVL